MQWTQWLFLVSHQLYRPLRFFIYVHVGVIFATSQTKPSYFTVYKNDEITLSLFLDALEKLFFFIK